MKNHVKGLLALAILVSGGGLLFAQGAALVTAKVDFEFGAGGKMLSAGRYEIRHPSANSNILTFRNIENGKSENVQFLTRLGPREENKAALVFDKDGSQTILTEIHVSGEDGYLLKGSPGQHSHETVPAGE